jgi:hypothetical protein
VKILGDNRSMLTLEISPSLLGKLLGKQEKSRGRHQINDYSVTGHSLLIQLARQ